MQADRKLTRWSRNRTQDLLTKRQLCEPLEHQQGPAAMKWKYFWKRNSELGSKKMISLKNFILRFHQIFFFIWIFLLLSNEEKKLIETESSFKLNVFYPWRTFSMKSQLEENQVKLQLSLTKCECISWPHFCKGCSCLANRIIEIKSLEVFLEFNAGFLFKVSSGASSFALLSGDWYWDLSPLVEWFDKVERSSRV